jgi:succinoglycan biosynthesis protein ExoL
MRVGERPIIPGAHQSPEINPTISVSIRQKFVYFAHDLSDPAVHRRVRMLQAGGSEVVVLGFRRSVEPVRSIDNIELIDLGKTSSRQFAKRIGSVLKALAILGRHRRVLHGATVIIARQLEMLVVASNARLRFAPGAALVFECLDIHRMMVSPKPAGKVMRWIERTLLRRCDLLIVSSPAFLSEYFERVHPALPRTLLLENKVLASETGPAEGNPGQLLPGPPWRIGWYGSVRCQRSLHLLADLVRRLPGQVEVIIRGNADPAVMPDLDEVVAASPGLELHGPYDRRTDLASMYASVHFAWAMDFFEPSGNSEWLLPNRLYEGGLYGALPIALQSAETGHWLEGHGVGVVLGEPVQETLIEFFKTTDTSRYELERAAFSRVPRSAFVYDDQDCAAICELLMELRHHD